MDMTQENKFLGELRQLQAGERLTVSRKTDEWMDSLSLIKSGLDDFGKLKDPKRSNTGHLYENVNGSVNMFIMMNFFLLLFAVIYMSHRIYIGKKYMNDKATQERRKYQYKQKD